MAVKMEFADLDDLVRSYEAGASMKQLAHERGISRTPLLRALVAAGVKIRGRSDAELTKWRRMRDVPGAVARQVRAAHAARRGQKDGPDVIAARTRYFSKIGLRIGKHERELLAALGGYGGFRAQVPVGTFAIDIASEELRVAVEIQASNHLKPHSSIRRERIEHLMDREWSVLIVWIPQHSSPDIEKLRDQVIAFSQLVRGLPAGERQYGVIGRHGQPVTPKGLDLPRRTRVPGF